MSSVTGPKSCGFLHHNQVFNVIVETSDYDVQNLIVMQKTHGILPEACNKWRTHLRSLAPGRHNSEKTSQQWQAVGEILSDLTGSGIESYTSIAVFLTSEPTVVIFRPVKMLKKP